MLQLGYFGLVAWIVSLCPSKSRVRVWNVLFCAVVWTIWEFCNKVVFQGMDTNVPMTLDSIKSRVVWWFKYFRCGSSEDITMLLLDVEGRC